MKELVSIIMPSYNSKDFISDSIQSVMSQTYSNWELIIVDDCSTDGTQALLAEWEQADKRIHVKYRKENGGAAMARNMAIDNASGRYIAFLDSDDRWKPHKLELQLGFMQENSYAFTFSSYEYITRDGESLKKWVHAPKVISYQDMLKNTIVGCLTVIVDRSIVGPFQMPNIRTRQDLATWLSILKKGHNAYGMTEILAEYRVGNDSISNNKWKSAQKTWFVYREIERLNLAKAAWCFSHYAYHAIRKRM